MRVQLNGIEINYEVCGSGPALIMLHGNSETHAIFKSAAKKLSKHFMVYMPDTRGHGESTECSEFSYEDFAEDLTEFCRVLGIAQPVVYGFSDGGITALIAASKHPESFRALVVSGANLRPDGLRRMWLGLFTKMYERYRDPKFKLMITQPDIKHSELEKIKIPVLVLAGGRDIVKREHTNEIAAALPDAQKKILPFDGHGSYVDNSPRIGKYIIAFCRSRGIIE